METLPTWLQIVILLISSFIGGGLVSFVYQAIADKRKVEIIKKMYHAEINLNLAAIKAKSRKVPIYFTSFYNANADSLYVLDHETAVAIVEFYGKLEMLREVRENPNNVSQARIQKAEVDILELLEREGTSLMQQLNK